METPHRKTIVVPTDGPIEPRPTPAAVPLVCWGPVAVRAVRRARARHVEAHLFRRARRAAVCVTRDQRAGEVIDEYLVSALDRGQAVGLALHEAGHATAAHVLGGRVSVVSIRPTAGWGGVCFRNRPRFEHDDTALDVEAALPLWPLHLRAGQECELIVTLAGPRAQAALMPPPRGCRDDPALAREVRHLCLDRACG